MTGARLELQHAALAEEQASELAAAQEQEHARLALELEQRQQGSQADVDEAAADAGARRHHRRGDAMQPDQQLLVEKRARDEVADARAIGLEARQIALVTGEHQRDVGERRVLGHRMGEIDARHTLHRRRRDDRIGAPRCARAERLGRGLHRAHLEAASLERPTHARAQWRRGLDHDHVHGSHEARARGLPREAVHVGAELEARRTVGSDELESHPGVTAEHPGGRRREHVRDAAEQLQQLAVGERHPDLADLADGEQRLGADEQPVGREIFGFCRDDACRSIELDSATTHQSQIATSSSARHR